MNTEIKNTKIILIYLLPTAALCLYFLFSSYLMPLHDFSNSYFSARLLHDGIPPETVIFDIHAFNNYIWELGYTDVFVDFYVNSPFTLSAFYPLAYIDNPYIAKLTFNSISIALFLIGLVLLAKKTLYNSRWILLVIPVIFYVPIRNQILFGQSYFIILFCVILGYYFLDKKKKHLTGFFLGFAVLLKFFPVFYGIPLAFQKKWKTIGWCILGTIVVGVIGVSITGYPLWEAYFLDILPHTFLSNTTTDYRPNYQSLDVFFKTLFVEDAYYNPKAWIADGRIYGFANWITKAIILGSAIAISIRKKNNTLILLAVWVTTLFLTQDRTATYAQILWIIPLFVVCRLSVKLRYKLLLIVLLAVICNFPFRVLASSLVGIQFSRLWLVILLSLCIYKMIGGKLYLRYIALVFAVLFPMFYGTMIRTTTDASHYALTEKKHFMIYDFFNDQGKLAYKALGKNGDESITTDISITSFDAHTITIKEHQIYEGERLIITDEALKKKPVLVNNSRVYYLTDHHSRRGAFTLKYIDLYN